MVAADVARFIHLAVLSYLLFLDDDDLKWSAKASKADEDNDDNVDDEDNDFELRSLRIRADWDPMMTKATQSEAQNIGMTRARVLIDNIIEVSRR